MPDGGDCLAVLAVALEETPTECAGPRLAAAGRAHGRCRRVRTLVDALRSDHGNRFFRRQLRIVAVRAPEVGFIVAGSVPNIVHWFNLYLYATFARYFRTEFFDPDSPDSLIYVYGSSP
ncbi:hypothetical protein ACEXOS_009935 [Herbiconiux sp. P16]|uniref:hypothetical protein n=1 Tax=Herbiconiux wuyangfengii TaxID=3342794 RepID=UPI0035B9CA2D